MSLWRKFRKQKRRLWKAHRERRRLKRDLPAAWSRLPPEIVERLESMYRDDPQPDLNGELQAQDGKTKLTREKGCVLFELHERAKPDASLEVGLAYGYSTLYFLAAIQNSGAGHHTAIDPFADAHWSGIGRLHAERLGLGEHFTCYQDQSVAVLPRLAAEGRRFQLAFIDGDHRFDGAFMDFCQSAALLDEGGYIALDDMWMPSVRKVASFIRKNRDDFVEEKQPSKLAVFRRVGQDERHWTHYRRF